MEPKTLIKGLVFARDHNLSVKEMEVLIHYIQDDFTTLELSKVMNVLKTTLNNVIQRLKLKGLLKLKGKDNEKNNIYAFNLPKE